MKTIVFRYMVFGMTRVCTITTDQLIDAIAVVESNRGATSENVYQLKPIYVRDVCRITRQTLTHEQATSSDEIARWCIGAYWEHYGARCARISGKAADAQALARIHNGGPDGWRKPETLPYWRRVSEALITNGFKGK